MKLTFLTVYFRIFLMKMGYALKYLVVWGFFLLKMWGFVLGCFFGGVFLRK